MNPSQVQYGNALKTGVVSHSDKLPFTGMNLGTAIGIAVILIASGVMVYCLSGLRRAR